jgi:hypothetical protein
MLTILRAETPLIIKVRASNSRKPKALRPMGPPSPYTSSMEMNNFLI